MGSTSQDPNISNSRTPAANTINRLIDTDGAHDTNADKQGTPSTAPASNPARDFLVNPNQVSSLQEYRTAFQRNETSLPANVAHPRFLNAHIFNASTSVTGNGEPSAVFGIPPLPREDASATAGDVPVAKKQRKSTAKRAEQAVARAAADASHGNVKESEGAIRPRQRNKWTDEEILALAEGMQVYGTNWAGLLNDPRFKGPLERRSQMQCKDKAAVEKEKRVKEALKEGRIVTIEELGVWRYACDRKRTFKAVGGVVQQQQQETGTGESPVDLVAGTQGDGGSSGPVGAGAGLVG
ncbi:hypothetical protein BC830DRAFT_1127240 [Chytriomyces sp. MP71]|nr:hypothetical protein BC830DRAFT_1127240 [Chytriomyces sp. MP71]